MATSQLPAVIDALVALAITNLPDDVVVSDGFQVSSDPGDYVMVGVDATDVLSAATAGSSTQSAATAGTPRSRDERGSVTICAESWNGDGDQKAARDAAYSYLAAFETFLRADPKLGLAAEGLMVAELGATQALLQNQTNDGATALVIFTVAFWARI